MDKHLWKIVPLSEGQLKDVRAEDILDNGHFRKCETYRGGGGYDQFPFIARERLGFEYHKQFIAQLYGCNLDCPYCYVTRAGVWGTPVMYTTEDLVAAYVRSGQGVFHLMGGAPAIYLEHWPELIEALPSGAVFHSDLMCTERLYTADQIRAIAKPNCLYAVNVKGMTQEEHMTNTRKPLPATRFWANLRLLADLMPENFYITFTNVARENQEMFWAHCKAWLPWEKHRMSSFTIDLIEYDAQPYVDSVPWGPQRKVTV
jgi:pyruvate-formate lyase-activating enzyme